ncbi:MAG: hypothetical protein U0838_17500 [Chloroflexota bacterium]
MSSYTVSTAQITTERLRAGFSRLLTQAGECVSSAALARTCAQIAAVDATALDARWQAIDALAGARAVLATGAPDQLAAARRFTVAAKQATLVGDDASARVLASQAHDALGIATAQVLETLRRDERAAVQTAASTALQKMGFDVSSAVGQRSSGLWAELGYAVVAVLVQDGGAMEIDNAGVVGGSCTRTMKAFEALLREEGVETSVRRRVDHGDPGGGSMIRRAGQIGARRPAAGLVAQFEQGVPKTPRETIDVATPQAARHRV